MSENYRKRPVMGRIAALGTSGTVAAVAALMLLAPISQAASANVLIIKPFTKLGAQISYYLSHGGCATAKQVKTPTWSKKTGTFRAAGWSRAPSCAASASSNSADWQGSLGLTLPFKFKTTGNHTITTTLKITDSAVWNMTPYKGCVLNYAVSYSVCLTEASVNVFVYSYLYDENNGSYFNFGGFISQSNFSYSENYSDNYCYLSTCYHYGGNTSFGTANGSFSGSTVQYSNISATGSYAITNSSDTFQLTIYVDVYTYASAYTSNAKGIGKASAYAAVNAGTLGNGVVLGSISIV